jgi:hypothetical protein
MKEEGRNRPSYFLTGVSRITFCTSSADGTPFIAPSRVQLRPAAALA